MNSLNEYAVAHGAPVEAFVNAGYKEVNHQGKQALAFPTNGGMRYRLLEGNSKYTNTIGNTSVWFRLDEALAIANEIRVPLIITNGEASVIAAQYHKLPATAITNGEKTSIPEHLITELQAKYTKTHKETKIIFLAYDSDKTGRNATNGVAHQLEKLGYTVVAIDFGEDNGYDLADWIRDHETVTLGELQNSTSLHYDFDDGTEYIGTNGESVEGNRELQELIQQISERFPWIEYAEQFGEVVPLSRGEYRIAGKGWGDFNLTQTRGSGLFSTIRPLNAVTLSTLCSSGCSVKSMTR